MSGAAAPVGVRKMLEEAGFVNVDIEIKAGGRDVVAGFGIPDAENYVVPAYILARKPGGKP